VIAWTARDKIVCAPQAHAALLATWDGSPKGGDAGRCVGGSVHDSPAAGGGSRNGLMGDWREGVESAVPIAQHPTAAELLRYSNPAMGQERAPAGEIAR
jgi:hypothetical protein